MTLSLSTMKHPIDDFTSELKKRLLGKVVQVKTDSVVQDAFLNEKSYVDGGDFLAKNMKARVSSVIYLNSLMGAYQDYSGSKVVITLDMSEFTGFNNSHEASNWYDAAMDIQNVTRNLVDLSYQQDNLIFSFNKLKTVAAQAGVSEVDYLISALEAAMSIAD